MSPELKSIVARLVDLDEKEHEDRQKDRAGQSGQWFDLRNGTPSLVFRELETLSRDHLAYVLALMWFGRGDDDEDGATFDSHLAHAQRYLQPNAAEYLSGKPLRIYLTRGLERLAGMF